jgi:hypothetical protein
MKKTMISTVIACLVAVSALAQNTWNGNVSNSWHVAGNWSLNRVPLSSDNVVIVSGPANQPVISTGNAVCNNLTINSGATLTVNSSRVITVYGNWANQAGATGFIPGTGTVVFSGSNNQTIQQGLGAEKFHHFVVDKAPGKDARPFANLVFHGNFTLNSGNFSATNEGYTYTFHGNVHFDGSGLFWPQGSAIFAGSGNTYYFNSGYNAGFNDFKLDKTSPDYTLLLLSDLAPGGLNFTTINKGTLDLGGFKFTPNSEIVINAGGKLRVPAGSWLSIRDGLTINNGGVFEAAGLEGNMAYVYKDAMGTYPFTVNSGGIIMAGYTWFTNMDANGIFIKSGAIVDPDHAFNHCSFAHGAPGGVLMTISNNQHLNSLGAHFPANNWGGSHNVRKTNNAGSITFNAVSGDFAGPAFEDDIHGRVHWSFTPVNRHINSAAVYNSEIKCFDALQNITVQNFWVLVGGSATMIAGESIKFLPSTEVYNGAHLHAYITTNQQFCNLEASLLSSAAEAGLPDTESLASLENSFLNDSRQLKIYPNPNTGLFSIEPDEVMPGIILEIFNLHGGLVHRTELNEGTSVQVNLTDNPPGVYLIRAICGSNTQTARIIKQ